MVEPFFNILNFQIDKCNLTGSDQGYQTVKLTLTLKIIGIEKNSLDIIIR